MVDGTQAGARSFSLFPVGQSPAFDMSSPISFPRIRHLIELYLFSLARKLAEYFASFRTLVFAERGSASPSDFVLYTWVAVGVAAELLPQHFPFPKLRRENWGLLKDLCGVLCLALNI
jgi:hypothetical protein